jgi:hypothetical protein
MTTSDFTPEPVQLLLILEDKTISILLTKGFVTIVDAVDADLLQYKWSVKLSRKTEYAARGIGKNNKVITIRMHRVILSRILGRDLINGEVVDHINGNGLDNRRSNLRLATVAENNRNANKSMKPVSGLKGAYPIRDRWRSYICIDRKQIYLGEYDTAREAHVAYCEAAKKYHGEFANFGED